jgi:hypothetical protein
VATAHQQIIEMGGAVAGIGTAAPHQARHLMKRSIPYPLYLDPGRRAYDALGIGTQGWLRYIFNVRAWLRWLRAFVVRGHGRITGHHSTLPGVAIIGPGDQVHHVHRGRSLGDYPRLGEVLDRMQWATGNK